MEDSTIISYQRDHFVDTSDLTMPFIDDISGTIRGYRIFTACRTVNGKIFRLEDHLDRLYYSASSIHMMPPLNREQLREVLDKVVQRNREEGVSDDLVIDVVFSGGLAGTTMVQSGTGAHLYIAVDKLVPPPPEAYEKGVVLATFAHQRLCPDVKLLNYIGAVIAHQTAVPAQSAFDVLFTCPPNGKTILEGSTFSVFFVNGNGEVRTPPLDGRILGSITRRVLFDVAAETREFVIRETEISMDELSSFSEAFLASTTRNVVPIVRIDSQVLGAGVPGPVTRKVMRLVEDYVNNY
jgi:branched-subunit amino acid aminotransferase/4-amino-4-deoxychorismate lyase